MTDEGRSYRCPRCKKDVSLWQGVDVPGWRAIDAHLHRGAELERDVMWSDAEPNGDYGCGECGWEGTRDGLEALGTDGEPLPFVHPGQLTVEDMVA